MYVVLDTNVLTDCLLAHRPRHSSAVRLARLLREKHETVLLPVHGLFELVSAIRAEGTEHGLPMRLGELGKSVPFDLQLVPIDMEFFESHLLDPLKSGRLISLKGGDMIFVAIAAKHAARLITGDKQMARVAEEVGVRVSSIEGYLRACG